MDHFKQEFFVSKSKIKQYLLNRDHPDGGSKAKYFVRYGFNLAKWRVFGDAICKQARNNPVKETEKTEYGTIPTTVGRWCYANTDE